MTGDRDALASCIYHGPPKAWASLSPKARQVYVDAAQRVLDSDWLADVKSDAWVSGYDAGSDGRWSGS